MARDGGHQPGLNRFNGIKLVEGQELLKGLVKDAGVIDVIVHAHTQHVRDAPWSKSIHLRKQANESAKDRGGERRQSISARPHGKTGGHGHEDKADVTRLSHGTSEPNDGKSGEHSKSRGLTSPDNHDDNGHNRAQEKKRMDIVLGVFGAAIGALIDVSDEAVEDKAQYQRTQHFGSGGVLRARRVD